MGLYSIELQQSRLLLCLYSRGHILEWTSQRRHRAVHKPSFSEECLTTRVVRALGDKEFSVSWHFNVLGNNGSTFAKLWVGRCMLVSHEIARTWTYA